MGKKEFSIKVSPVIKRVRVRDRRTYGGPRPKFTEEIKVRIDLVLKNRLVKIAMTKPEELPVLVRTALRAFAASEEAALHIETPRPESKVSHE